MSIVCRDLSSEIEAIDVDFDAVAGLKPTAAKKKTPGRGDVPALLAPQGSPDEFGPFV